MAHSSPQPRPGGPVPSARPALRVVSYNIHHGADVAERPSLDRIGDVLDRLEPDVIVLPEVDRFWRRSRFVDQPAWFSERLGMQAEYAPALHRPAERPGGPDREYGVLLLSRLPLSEVRRIPLPRTGDCEPRTLITARADLEGRSVTVAGAHLEHAEATLRAQQATAVLEALPEQGDPVVLAGDFNDSARSPALRTLTSRLQDSWVAAGVGPRCTYRGCFLDPRRLRIDYVLTEGMHCVRAEVHRPSPPPSDHRPLVVDLEI